MIKLIMKVIFDVTVMVSSFIMYAEAVEPIVIVEAYEKVVYDNNVDYRQKMYECAKIGGEDYLALGYVYETQRNAKLIAMGQHDKITEYFTPSKSSSEIFIEIISDDMRDEYSTAGHVYELLAKEGYSDAIIAAILGNMMNEVGGNTLELKPFTYDTSSKYYGLCQWNLKYNADVSGRDIHGQIEYLLGNIEKEMNMFGGSYDAFMKLDAVEYAGVYFGKYYERGINLTQRGLNAIKAYEWIRSFKK